MEHFNQHAVMPLANHDEQAAENFCRHLAIKLASEVRPVLAEIYESQVQPEFVKKHGRKPDHREIAIEMRKIPEARFWYRLRTDNQDRMYYVSGSMIERQASGISEKAKMLSGKLGSLTLNPSVNMPRYLTEVDIHRKPGGYHAESRVGDVTAGAQYDRTIAVHNMGSQGENNDDPACSIAAWVIDTHPNLKPRRILDMGCTIGNNTLPYKTAFPDAEMHAIDVSSPALRYAHARACDLGVDVHFHQMNAEKTDFEDGSFDLIVSRILLHETSKTALPKIIRECHRLLSPRGLMLHCDAPQFDSLTPYQASLRDWDTTCNNEPFMATLYTISLEQLYAQCGFEITKTFCHSIPGIFIREHSIDGNATPGFSPEYFFTGAQK